MPVSFAAIADACAEWPRRQSHIRQAQRGMWAVWALEPCIVSPVWQKTGFTITRQGTRVPLNRCFHKHGMIVVGMDFDFFARSCSTHMVLTARELSCRIDNPIRAYSAPTSQPEMLKALRRYDVHHTIPGLLRGPIRGYIMVPQIIATHVRRFVVKFVGVLPGGVLAAHLVGGEYSGGDDASHKKCVMPPAKGATRRRKGWRTRRSFGT